MEDQKFALVVEWNKFIKRVYWVSNAVIMNIDFVDDKWRQASICKYHSGTKLLSIKYKLIRKYLYLLLLKLTYNNIELLILIVRDIYTWEKVYTNNGWKKVDVINEFALCNI